MIDDQVCESPRRTEAHRKIRERISQAEITKGFLDEDCIRFLVGMIDSGQAKSSDVTAVAGPEVGRIIHAAYVVNQSERIRNRL